MNLSMTDPFGTAAGPADTAGWGRAAVLVIGVVLAARLLLAALIPLVPDEAYYALWSKGLASGYFDHPPMVAYFIRLGVVAVGDNALGVRLVCVLAAVPTSLFVWRAADLLLEDRRAGPLAAILYNLTIFGFVGLTLATPDAPLALFCAAMTYFAACLTVDNRARMWLAFGAATGLALLSKYSAAMLAGGFALAVLAAPALRRELLRPWPWLSLVLALVIFLPNLLWNADHGWETFVKQGGRVLDNPHLQLRYLPEFIAAQVGLATPLIFLFAMLGLLRSRAGAFRPGSARLLLLFMLLTPCAYFAFHALRTRVEGNWLGFLYPLLAIAAAAGLLAPQNALSRSLSRLRKATLPLAACLLLALGIQAAFAPVTALGRKDPIVRMTRGWPDFAREVDTLRQSLGAQYVLTDNYQLNAVLVREMPEIPVEQYNERNRYRFLVQPDPAELDGVGLVLLGHRTQAQAEEQLGPLVPAGTLTRRFRGLAVETVRAYRLQRPPSAG